MAANTFDHSRTLFMKEDGTPMTFHMRPCSERKYLRQLIEHGGGIMTSKAREDCIRLAEKGSTVTSENYISSKYITECVKENRILDKTKFRYLPAADDGMEPASVIIRIDERLTKGRKKYSAQDDKNIVKYLIEKKLHTQIRGKKIWRDMEFIEITCHSSESMRDHMLKVILPNINSYDFPSHWKSLLTGNTSAALDKQEDEEIVIENDASRSDNDSEGPVVKIGASLSSSRKAVEKENDGEHRTQTVSSSKLFNVGKNTESVVSPRSSPRKTQVTECIGSPSKSPRKHLLKESIGSASTSPGKHLLKESIDSASKSPRKHLLKESIGSASTSPGKHLLKESIGSPSKSPRKHLLKESIGSASTSPGKHLLKESIDSASKSPRKHLLKESIGSASKSPRKHLLKESIGSPSKSPRKHLLKESIGSASTSPGKHLLKESIDSASKSPGKHLLKESIDSASKSPGKHLLKESIGSASKSPGKHLLKESIGSASKSPGENLLKESIGSASKSPGKDLLKESIGSASKSPRKHLLTANVDAVAKSPKKRRLNSIDTSSEELTEKAEQEPEKISVKTTQDEEISSKRKRRGQSREPMTGGSEGQCHDEPILISSLDFTDPTLNNQSNNDYQSPQSPDSSTRLNNDQDEHKRKEEDNSLSEAYDDDDDDDEDELDKELFKMTKKQTANKQDNSKRMSDDSEGQSPLRTKQKQQNSEKVSKDHQSRLRNRQKHDSPKQKSDDSKGHSPERTRQKQKQCQSSEKTRKYRFVKALGKSSNAETDKEIEKTESDSSDEDSLDIQCHWQALEESAMLHTDDTEVIAKQRKRKMEDDDDSLPKISSKRKSAKTNTPVEVDSPDSSDDEQLVKDCNTIQVFLHGQLTMIRFCKVIMKQRETDWLVI
ncbi:protein SCAF11-like isoform X2 [Gigantopelta aegis]|uniref:protein SCAF11-like isoform X2 n=1 Tax=Gigantopelta aegis TaxID=1735272 RepID=UPI001B8887BE|nr:protein SCAF11-like isoform X2 [Gigantopelta aegis]